MSGEETKAPSMAHSVLLAIVEENASAVVDAFHTAMLSKQELLIENRRHKVASNLLFEGDGDEDEDDNSDDMDWDDEILDDPEEFESDDDSEDETSDDETNDESTDE